MLPAWFYLCKKVLCLYIHGYVTGIVAGSSTEKVVKILKSHCEESMRVANEKFKQGERTEKVEHRCTWLCNFLLLAEKTECRHGDNGWLEVDEAKGKGRTLKATKIWYLNTASIPSIFCYSNLFSHTAALDLKISSPFTDNHSFSLIPCPFSFVNLETKGHYFSHSLASGPQKNKQLV